ncbi:MAG TPA: sensor histidine kinase [Firmicutes bacterium]|nr:sensor histidine kinase [Bacillota bacterium]
MRFGLRTKLVSLVLLILTPLFVLEVVSIYRNFERRTEQELQASRELAETASAAFINYLENLWDSEMAMGTAITSGLAPATVQAYLRAQLSAHPTVESFSWVNPAGIVLEATQAGSRGLSCADREHVRRVIAGEDQAISGLLLNRVSREPVVFVARGIRREGRLLGIVVASLRPTRFGLALPIERTGRSNLGLADHNGTIVYRSNDPELNEVGKTLPDYAPGRKVLQTGEPVLSRDYRSPFEDVRRMGAFVLIPRIGWIAMASARVDEVLAEAWADARRDLTVLLVVTAVSLAAAFLLGSTLLRPLASLQRAAVAIARGELKARVQLAGSDELAVTGQAFDQMAERIQKLETERSRFLEIAAAALRNPMTTAKGACSLLRLRLTQGDADPAEVLEDLRIMEREIDRLSSLLDEVLDAFCCHEGRLAVWREPVNLGDLVGRVLETFTALDPDHRFVFEERGTARVFGDPRRLEDVVRNLVGNAAKFSPAGSEVRVRLEVRDNRAVLSVKDEGIGIPRGELDDVFRSFYRASNLEGRDPGGLGLGLYISQSIVADHGGRLWAESEEGKGSVFHVELPRLSML